MIIACQDSLMHFCPAALQGSAQVPNGYLPMSDLQLDDCFARLAEGRDVWVWQHRGARHLADYLAARYRFVKAAGGMVVSPEGDCLMIYRQGRWDLPKGMVEPGETLAQAALREVEEETGIRPTATGRLITKTSWFAMEAQRLQPRPQTEEDIAQALWVPRQNCLERLRNSFASLRLLSRIVSPKESTTP